MKDGKSWMKKWIVGVLMVFTFSMLVPEIIPNADAPTVVEAGTPKLNAKKATLIKGQTKVLKVTGTKKAVKWSSSKKSVAAVNKKGKVTAKKRGTAVVSAKVAGKTYKCTITVEEPQISKKSVSVSVGKTTALKVNGTKQKVKWSSNNKKIATVSGKGVVKGVKKGTATITAKVSNKKYTCKVTVKEKEIPVTEVRLNKESTTLEIGDTTKLEAMVSPGNATDRTIAWSSSKTAVATVNSQGVVTAKSVGTAYIYAKAGGEMAICKVVVIEQQPEEPSFSSYLYSKSSVTNVLILAIENLGTLPMTMDDYYLLGDEDYDTNLWLVDDNAEFIDFYNLYPGEEEYLGLCRADYSDFYVFSTSTCTFSFTYDDIEYVALVYYTGGGVYDVLDGDNAVKANITIRPATLEKTIKSFRPGANNKIDKFYDTLKEKAETM